MDFSAQVDLMWKGFYERFPENGGVCSLIATHPEAPHLHICTNPNLMEQSVPFLLARAEGRSPEQQQLGLRFYQEAPDWLRMFHVFKTRDPRGEEFCYLFLPFLFDRAPESDESFFTKAADACEQLQEAGQLSAWSCTPTIGMIIQTRDGRVHKYEDYPNAF